ncbi:MAG TPA: T9SS type A sorting domain-containing protein [Flavobacteriales bacterium]|nr:T9SS type A sorting domain-containing protein [Flavobacteriales bacterium]
MQTRLRTAGSILTIACLLGCSDFLSAQENGAKAVHLDARNALSVGGPIEIDLSGNDHPAAPVPGPAGPALQQDDRGQCTPDGLTLLNEGCGPDGNGGSAPQIRVIFHINGTCYVGNLCWTINGGPWNCNFIGAGNDIQDGGIVILTGCQPNSTYVFYFTTIGGTSGQFSYTTGDCVPDPCFPENLIALANGCTLVEDEVLPTVRLTFTMDGGCVAQTLCWTAGGAPEECLNLVEAGTILHSGDHYDFTGAQVNTAYTFRFTTAEGTSETVAFTTGDCEGADCLPVGMSFSNEPCEEFDGLYYATILMTFDIHGDCEVEDFCYTVNGETNCVNLPEEDIHMLDGDQLYLHHTLPNSEYTITYTTSGGVSETFTWQTIECFDCFPQNLVLTHNSCQGTSLEIINVRFNIDGNCYAEDLCWTVDGGEVECFNLPGFETYMYDNYTWQFGNWDGPVTYQFYFTTEGGQSNTYTYHGHDCDPAGPDAVEELAFGDVAIYPSPVQDRLSIRTEHRGDYELTILDQLGRAVVRKGFNGDRYDLPVAHLPEGVYSVVLATDQARMVRRVVKQ